MKGFPKITPLKSFIKLGFDDEEIDVSLFPYNHILSFRYELGENDGKVSMELYDFQGRISQRIADHTNRDGGAFNSGKKIQFQFGWNEGGRLIESRVHKMQITKVNPSWNINTGFTYTIDGISILEVLNKKKNITGNFSGKPADAIDKILKAALAGSSNIPKIYYGKKGFKELNNDFFENEEVVIEGNNSSYLDLISEVLRKSKASDGSDKMFHFSDSAENEIRILTGFDNDISINDKYFDGKSFEFGRLPSGSKTYLTDFDFETDSLFLGLSRGVESKTQTDVHDKKDNQKAIQGEGKKVESKDQKGSFGNKKTKIEINVESETMIRTLSPNIMVDDESGKRTPQEINKTRTTQLQIELDKLASSASATFIGNPLLDISKEIVGAKLKFDVYINPLDTEGSFKNTNKPLSITTESRGVVHEIQGGQFTTTFKNMVMQSTKNK